MDDDNDLHEDYSSYPSYLRDRAMHRENYPHRNRSYCRSSGSSRSKPLPLSKILVSLVVFGILLAVIFFLCI